MAKNNKGSKSAAQKAGEQSAPKTKTTVENPTASTKETGIAVITLGDLDKLAQTRALAGLDPNHTVDLLKMMHETYRLDPKAAEHIGISQEAVDKINSITAIGQVAALTNEIALAQTPFAIRMRVSQLEAIKEVAPLLGVTVDTKSLPAPDENGDVTVSVDPKHPEKSNITISPEAAEAAKEEREAAAKKVITDPTKIENDDQLKATLLSLLVKGNGNENFYAKVMSAISFYESYLKVKANKSDDKEAVLAALKKKTRAEFLTEISELLGRCTFTINGMAKHMYEHTERTKNPVVAFCLFRSASMNEKTGVSHIEDEACADIVKVLISWYGKSLIQEANRQIENFNKDIETLKKDAKKNEKAIKQGEEKIANAKKYIDDVLAVIGYTNCPSASIVEAFVNDYTDSKREGYKFARMMGSKIMESYYPGTDSKTIDQTNLLHNLQQRMGIIFNLFLPPMSSLTDYSEANITELKVAEKADGEGEKNA